MTETENLHLKKPSQEDFYNVDDFNQNADLLDAKIGDMVTQLVHKVDTNEVAQPNGIATLDSSGKLAQMQSADILWSGELTSTSAAPSTVTLSNGINQYRLVAVVTALGSSISSYRLLNLYDCMTMGQASQRIRYNDASAVVTSTMRWRSGGDYTKVQFDAVPAGWVITHVIGYR